MPGILISKGVMTAPDGRNILDEFHCSDCEVKVTRRSTKNYEMVVTMPSGLAHTLQFDAAAGGDVMLTLDDMPDEPIAA